MPSKSQSESIGNNTNAYVTSFFPILGGSYIAGTLESESTRGFWWGSTAYNGAARHILIYNDSILYRGNSGRRTGLYIRCIQAS
ncbi:hypothetical protein IKF84_01705 [Candidatus Saccharibacteria bacterium]|nr:hypothetical protein [Candidatus Saccharibacteria bacterium]